MKIRHKSFLFGLATLLLLPGIMKAQKGVKIGLLALPQSTWLFNSDDWNAAKDIYDHKFTFGMAAGPIFGYNFSENFGFRTNFLYSLQGQHYHSRNAELELVTHKIRLHYVKMPIMFGFNTNTEFSKMIFSFYVGFQGNLLMRAQYQDNNQSFVADPSLDPTILDYPSSFRQYNWFDYGPVLDIGFDVKLTYNIMANLHLRAEYGLGDAENKGATITRIENGVVFRESFWPETRPATQNYVGGLTFGLTYTFTSY